MVLGLCGVGMRIVPDTSVIIDGRITAKLRDGEWDSPEVLISEAVLSELEAQANSGQEIGSRGLEEVQALRELCEHGRITLAFRGRRPSLEQIKLASSGEIDAVIRDLAYEENATLVTSDFVQAEVARAKGVPVVFLRPEVRYDFVKEIADYFSAETMSVHLKEGCSPKAKVGVPGSMRIVEIEPKVMSRHEVERLAQKIVGSARRSVEGFIEFDRGGGTVVQLRDIRIVIARPPFADGWEITAVRPVTRVGFEEYRFSEELKERLSSRQRGVIVAGPPGAGKSTLAAAIAEYLLAHHYVVKTIEEPRDLVVSDEITQYGALNGKFANTADLLLLVRPDYTVFDELRKTDDFVVFADMRLAGVGMIGVTHANRGIDAVQRMLGRVDLGVIPQVIDTVIFIDEGKIASVFDITFTVKVPCGMLEADLSRPVVEVKDFETGEVKFEIYTYGEQVVVMPVANGALSLVVGKNPLWRFAERQIAHEMRRYVRGPVEAEVTGDAGATVYVLEQEIPALIGREGRHIAQIEEDLGLHLTVVAWNEDRGGSQRSSEPREVKVFREDDKIVLFAGKQRSQEDVEVFADNRYLTTATVGRDGYIRIRNDTPTGRDLEKEVEQGTAIHLK
jgi:ATPase